MDTNTLMNEQVIANTDEQRVPAIRELMDAELLLVGGGGGDVIWNTPTVPLP